MFSSCRIEKFCYPINLFKRINPDNQLIIESNCTDGCQTYSSISYNYDVFLNYGTMKSPKWNKINETFLKKYLNGNRFLSYTCNNN